MELRPVVARRAFALFGILWNGTIAGLMLFSDAPWAWRAAYGAYGGFAIVFMVAVWFGKEGAPVLGRAQVVAAIIAGALFALGALLYRA